MSTGRQRVSAPYFDIAMSCGSLPPAQESEEREGKYDWLSSELVDRTDTTRGDTENMETMIQMYSLSGQRLLDQVDQRMVKTLQGVNAAGSRLATGVYLALVTVCGIGGPVRCEMKKLIVLTFARVK